MILHPIGFNSKSTGSVPEPSFAYFGYDAATYELDDTLASDRVAVVNVPDVDGVYQQVATTKVAYVGARHSGGVQYADDGTGVPLAQQPYAVSAPAATNYFLNALVPVTQTVSGRTGSHVVSCFGDGTVTLSGGMSGVVSAGSPVTGDPGGAAVVCTIAGGPPTWVMFEAGTVPTFPIYTTSAAATRDKDVIAAPSGDLNAAQGSVYFEIKPTTGTSNLIGAFVKLLNNFVVIDDGTNATAAAALVDDSVPSQVGMVWSPAGMKVCANGTWSQLVSYDGSLLSGALDVFRDSMYPGYIRNLKFWTVASESAIDILMPTPTDWGTDFVMVVKTTAASETFTLPCGNTGVYNAVIDWGDGGPTSTITTYNDADLVHTYATAGNHTIKISGQLPWIYFANGGDKAKLIAVLNGGSIGSISAYRMLYGCSNLVCADMSGFDTATVTSMTSMFHNCLSLTTIDVSGFDTAAVTHMGLMFAGCPNLTALDLFSFNTAAVGNMSSMFHDSPNLITLDLSSFDTAKVTSMSQMFRNCSGLTTLDLSSFDTAAVTSMLLMFSNATNVTSDSMDGFLSALYTSRMATTWETPEVDISPCQAPSGIYQDATPPTTGKEFAYKLENDPDAEGFNKWVITL